MTPADCDRLHRLWPEGTRDVGLMLHECPDPLLKRLAAIAWDSVTLRETLDEEIRTRNAIKEITP